MSSVIARHAACRRMCCLVASPEHRSTQRP